MFVWIYFTLFKLNVECGYEGMHDLLVNKCENIKVILSCIFTLHSIQFFIIGKQAWAYNIGSSNFNVCFAWWVGLPAVVDIVFPFQKIFDWTCKSILACL